ncbi:hypothetical protein DRP04_11070 [Archaeoglobales archaeon]|nr:MAG: hypothetical protein DRP04_11070 [Archaeoglobales archaeon]
MADETKEQQNVSLLPEEPEKQEKQVKKQAETTETSSTWVCDICGAEFSSYKSLARHYAGAHHASVPAEIKAKVKKRKEEPSPSPKKEKEKEPVEEQLEVEKTVEEEELEGVKLPSELDFLSELLDDYGVKRKRVVLRRLALTDPRDLRELCLTLEEIGCNKSRIRGIVSTYARWLGIKIPRDVIERLKPPLEEVEESYYPREWGYSGGWGEEKRHEDASAIAAVIKALSEWERARNPPQYKNPETESLKEEISALRQMIVSVLDQQRKNEIEELKKSIEELKKEKSDALTVAVQEASSILKEYVNVIKGIVSSSHHLSHPTVTEKVPGESIIIEELPEELIEEG